MEIDINQINRQTKETEERNKRIKKRNQDKDNNYGDMPMLELWKQLGNYGPAYERLLYFTYIARCYYKKKMEPIDFCKKTYRYQIAPLKLTQNSINFEEFFFLNKIENGFIDIESLNLTKESATFKNMSYSFNKVYFRKIINELVCKRDKDFAVIMGGAFTKYKPNIISEKFPSIAKAIAGKSDIDIYLQNTSYKHYYRKFTMLGVEIISVHHSHEVLNYIFNTIKIRSNCEIINIIFISKNQYQKIIVFKGGDKVIENPTSIDILNLFDYDICKIFYSFYFDKIFAFANLFEKYNEINSKCATKTIVKDLYLNKKEIEASSFANGNISLSNQDFDLYNKVYRYLKYAIKGYFKNAEEAQEHILLIEKLYESYFKNYPIK